MVPTCATEIEAWRPGPREVSADLVLRLQKYREPALAPRAIREGAQAAVATASRLASARGLVWRGPVTAVMDDGAVTLAEEHRFRSRLLARTLANARDAYVIVLTLGDALERRVEELFQTRAILDGFLLETAGWATIMRLARELRRHLLAQSRPLAATVTHRVAPGYGDWPVADQEALLRVFGDVKLPVRVTDSAWMLPRQSISGVFGVVATQ